MGRPGTKACAVKSNRGKEMRFHSPRSSPPGPIREEPVPPNPRFRPFQSPAFADHVNAGPTSNAVSMSERTVSSASGTRPEVFAVSPVWLEFIVGTCHLLVIIFVRAVEACGNVWSSQMGPSSHGALWSQFGLPERLGRMGYSREIAKCVLRASLRHRARRQLETERPRFNLVVVQ